MTSLILASALALSPTQHTGLENSSVYQETFFSGDFTRGCPTESQVLLNTIEAGQSLGYECYLTDAERQRIVMEIKFAIKKMNKCMDKAEMYASKITDLDIRDMTESAIRGAIGGLAGGSYYSVVLCSCLTTLADIGGRAYINFRKSEDWVREADVYARHADELQERLWRDE